MDWVKYGSFVFRDMMDLYHNEMQINRYLIDNTDIAGVAHK